MSVYSRNVHGCPDIASGLEAKRWLPERCFAPCFAALSYPCTIHLCSVLKLATGLEHENWPERGLAAVPLQFIGRVPKKCSKARLAKSSLRQHEHMEIINFEAKIG
ncbi:MAG: hypothetical protein C0392_02315 [Syntrophus sp. (in: bacteria)]|nr:hypothetical protein [Syntrophus sp. (in: bacteria)]